MKLLRHVLSHLILISFLIALVSVFYYRTLILPTDVVEKIEQVTNDVYPPALKFSSKRDYFWSIRGERIVSFDDLNLFENETVPVATAVETKTSAEEEIVVTEAADVTEEENKNVEEREESSEIVSKDSEEEKTVDVTKANIQEEEKAAEKVTDVAKSDIQEEEKAAAKAPKVLKTTETKQSEAIIAEVKDRDSSSERELLIGARKAFLQGKLIDSEKLYIELTQLEQDNPDAFGELGNVYYSQGKWNEAGQAYYQAAVRLITEGNHNQVAYLHRVIKGLNAEHAEKLSQKMMRR